MNVGLPCTAAFNVNILQAVLGPTEAAIVY